MQLTRNPYRTEEWGGRRPTLDDVSLIVEDPPLEVFAPNGEPILAYEKVESPDLLRQIRADMPTIKTFDEDARSGGLASRSTTFGSQPRITFRRNFCAIARLNRDHPAQGARLSELAVQAAEWYRTTNRPAYEEHLARVSKDVLPEWLLPGTPFTGGIVNDTAALSYHRDKGNVHGSWSAMVVLRDEGIDGGMLVIPELDLAVGTTNESILLFQGERWWHGVSPLLRRRRNTHRYSIVFYSLLQMRKCLCAADELERYKRVRTEREKNRLAGRLAEIDPTRAHRP